MALFLSPQISLMSAQIEDCWILISTPAFQSMALLHVSHVAFGKLPHTLRRE